MRITIIKGERYDRIEIHRDDGSAVATSFPKKGPVPHDFVHHAIESELGLKRGFWGMVAAGHDPEEIQPMAKAAGHFSAKRADVPAADFVEAIQAERIVEAFEADHWSGGEGSAAGVAYMADAGCAQSLVPPLALSVASVDRIRSRVANVAARWAALPVGGSIALDWPEAG